MAGDGRFRAALWLRAEKAMGLDWIPKPTRTASRQAAPAPTAAPVPKVPMQPVKTPTPVAQPRPKSNPPKADIAPSLHSLKPLAVGPALPTDEKRRLLADMDKNEVTICTKCRLCETRTHTVFGGGDPDAKLVFIGEGPGEEEDRTGQPFVGRSGKLLDRMIASMGLSRERVFIANIVKCRPPNNRLPMPDEVAACTPYLIRQLEIIRPQVIVTLGLASARYMLGDPKLAMGRIRGQWHDWRGVKLMPTYHPSYVLRTYTNEVRGMVWSDLQQVMKELGLPLTGRQ